MGKVEKFTPKLMQLRCSGEEVRIVKVAQGEKPSISKLDSADVFLYDTGFRVWLWVGKNADTQEKISAFPFAQKYLKDFKRPSMLPITRVNEGKEPQDFLSLFGPAKKGRRAWRCMIQ